MKVLIVLCAFIAVCFASGCTSSHDYATLSESGHLGCDYYYDRITVTWLINPEDTGLRLELTFTSFNTEAGYDYVYIYDGTSANAPLLGQYSGSFIPGPFVSSSNSLFVKFVSDPYVEGTGFSATWESFRDDDGGIAYCSSSHNYELDGGEGEFGCAGYANNIEVSWNIEANAGERVVLSFEDFNTERNYDYVYVYDGPSASSALIGQYSGFDLPPPVTASGHELYVVFSSDDSFTETGFTASYTSLVSAVDPCFNSTSKILLPYQGYIGCPYGYGNNVNSTWAITLLGDFIIELDFLSMGLASGDSIKVYDGSSFSAPLIGTYSGSNTPSPIISSGNRLLVLLTTDSSSTGNGFTASYESVHALPAGGCSHSGSFVLTDPEDTIGCSGYLNGVNIVWTIVSQDDHQIVNLVWHEFNTEANGDIITVYDGSDINAPVIQTASGSEIPDPVSSTGRNLTVQFVANTNNIQGTGFSAVYENVAVSDDSSTCTTSGTHLLTDFEGQFGCDGYGNNVAISWQIHVEQGNVIILDWDDFFTETGSDWITVYDGPDDTYNGLGAWSGVFRPPTITSNSNYLYITFQSDGSVTRSGFSASYTSYFTGSDSGDCYESQSLVLTEDSGNFGCSGYGNNVFVSWSISTPAGTVVDLQFTSFATEYNYDIVTIYDGSGDWAHQLGTYSGYTIPSAVQSSSNEVYVTFSSDSSITYDGFTLAYSSVETVSEIPTCSSDTSTTLTSPEGTFGCDGYSNSIDSSWLITAETGQRITLSFQFIDTETYYDYVKIYDGSNSHALLLNTLSGYVFPDDIHSSSNNLYVTFHSDSSISSGYEGFVANYVSFGDYDAACSSSASHTLTSSFGSFGCDGYSNSVTVSWYINVQTSSSIYINFENFNTEQNYDLVTIYDGSSENSPVLAIYSGSHAPPISSSSGQVYIKFTSDSSITRSGFEATYATLIIDEAE